MWDAVKFLMPLLLVSAVIISLDQHNKKGRYRKLWAGATILCCFLYVLTFLVGPPEFSSVPKTSSPDSPSGQVTRTKEPSGEAVPDNSPENRNGGFSGEGPVDVNNSGSTSGPEQTQDGLQNDRKVSEQPGGLQQDMLLPVDEAALDAGFKTFRDDLTAAVNRKDLNFLKDHLSPVIKYSFGENNGITGFLHQWQLDTKPGESGIWPELGEVLSLGGSFDKKRTVFTAPYVFANFPPALDGFENIVVTRPNVSVHTKPSSISPIIIGLSYKILKLADPKVYKSADAPQSGESAGWRRVETSAGTGFINEAYVRSPIDYRAQFRLENGGWKLMFFVAGD